MASELFKFKFNKQSSNSSVGEVGRLVLDEATFKSLKDLIYKKCGIYYNDTKKYLLEGRVAKRLEACKLKSFEEYFKFLNSSEGRNEMNELFKVITINETYFFRADQQFEALEKIIIPELIKQHKATGIQTLRIWSAASSTGEEAYTMAMIINEKLKRLYPDIKFQILASDISNAVLNSARKGIYKEYSVRNVPDLYMAKYFKKSGTNYILSEEIKQMVKFMQVNLYDQNTMRTITNCDVIFCCNVLIYFDIPSKQQVVSSLYNSLSKNGYLFVGYSESLHGVSKAFKLVHLPKAMAYKKD